MSDTPKKRLIEVNFPLKEVSESSVREKTIRYGHISTLHIWWARRPLAASRATALAALIPDNPAKREEYLQFIRDISPWDFVSKATPQNKVLLDHARKLILDANGGIPPKVLDCFAGGGAIPLEALRLGCQTYALDYNPVAVLIQKAALEYPQKFGKSKAVRDVSSGSLGMSGQRTVNVLLEAVRGTSNWVLEEAHKELERFYPRDKNGSIPVAYIWVRTLPCQNPECGAEIPLLRQTWLVKKEGKTLALRLIPEKAKKSIRFEIVEGKKIDFDPDEGTVSRAHVRCPICANTIADDETRQLFRDGKSGQRMICVALYHREQVGKTYRLPVESDLKAYAASEVALIEKRKTLWAEWGVDPIPDEPVKRVPISFGIINLWVYGIDSWGQIFNHRQQLALITFAEKVREAYKRLVSEGTEPEFAKAVVTYAAMILDGVADHCSTICQWRGGTEDTGHTFGRQALPMTWDYAETSPISGSTGSWASMTEMTTRVLSHICQFTDSLDTTAVAVHGSATKLPWEDNFFDAVLTDPPYYDNVPYSYISDFFYVWLKRTLGDLYPELFSTPLTPKTDEVVAYMNGGGPEEAKERFERMLTEAFSEIQRVLKPEGVAVIVFAYPKTEAWESVINAILKAGMYLTGSWPIHTEMQARLRAQESAALASSIYMVCRKRTSLEVGEFPKVRLEIEAKVREKLDKFWNEGIRGGDFFMSAIGPAVEVFGRYDRVEKLSGETVAVKELLDYVEKVVSEFALERILGSTELGGVDPETRFYLLWRWTYKNARVAFDEGNKLAHAVGIELKTLWENNGFVAKEKEFVRVLGPKEREKEKKFMNQAGFTTMVDALHLACIFWERGERKQLKEHLAQTYGANNTFWQVAQNIAEVLPDGDKEKQLLQGLLNVPEARDKITTSTGKLFS
jgi:adenine-specific DNA methylase